MGQAFPALVLSRASALEARAALTVEVPEGTTTIAPRRSYSSVMAGENPTALQETSFDGVQDAWTVVMALHMVNLSAAFGWRHNNENTTHI